MTLSIAEKLARPVARAMRRRAMRWYVLCTVVSTFAGAAAAFFVKVLPRDANWRVTCGNDSGGWRNRGELLRSAVSRCARRGSGAGHAASVPRRARADEPGRTRTCMTGLTVKEAADIVAVLCARRRRVRRGRANRPAKSRDVFIRGDSACFVEKERIWYGEESRNFVATRFQSAFFFQSGKNTGLQNTRCESLRVPPLVASRVSSSPRRRSREESRRGEPFARVSLPAASRVAFPSRRPRASRFPRQIPAEGSSLAR